MSGYNREDEGSIRTVKGREETAAETPRARKKKGAARPKVARVARADDEEDEDKGMFGDPEAEDGDEDEDDEDKEDGDGERSGDEWSASGDDEDADPFVDDDEDADDDEDEDGDSDEVSAAAGAKASDEPPEVSRKIRRRRKRSRPRSKTIAMKRLTREELRVGALMYPPVDIPRPATRQECRQDAGPCPWVACKHHLYLDVNPETGSIKINFPDLEPWELTHTCALDVAERGGITLEEVGEIMNLTRERIRQVEVRGLLKLKMASPSPDELGAGLLHPDDEN